MKSNSQCISESFLNTVFSPLVLGCLFLTMLNMKCRRESALCHFSSDFEGGAATNFRVRSGGAIGFSIPEEPGADIVEYPAATKPGEYLWFYLRVINDGKRPLEFAVENAFGAHQTGWRWKITKPVFSTDGHTWQRIEHATYSFIKHRLWRRGITLFGKPEFRFRLPVAAETVWIAYFNPYTNADLNKLIEDIRNSPEVTISTIGKSEENRDIVKVHIEMAGDKEKETIWVVCREHPGETPASFICEGMIHALLENPGGKRLREVYRFNIIPIINVDGVAHGYYYHNANGVNLSFDWEEFKAIETRLVREAIASDIKEGTMRLMINLHASNDPTKGHFFLKMSESELEPKDIEFQRAIFRAADGIYPQLQGHSPVMLWDVAGITGNALYRNHGVYCLYLESNYSRGADGSTVTPESLRKTGAALVEALARVLLSEK